jgi:hypothetical protein
LKTGEEVVKLMMKTIVFEGLMMVIIRDEIERMVVVVECKCSVFSGAGLGETGGVVVLMGVGQSHPVHRVVALGHQVFMFLADLLSVFGIDDGQSVASVLSTISQKKKSHVISFFGVRCEV